MLECCLRSLRRQTNKDFSVTVVDNGSEDGSIELLSKKFSDVKLVKFDYNSGFSVAVNAGITASRSDWILLLNNDMEVAPDCIEQLLHGISQYEEYDFFALKMYNYHNRDIIDGAGDTVLRGGVGYRLGTLEKDGTQYKTDRETFGACAGAALYSSSFFRTIGTFDPDFFAYLEDVDINMRARVSGLKCMFLADAKVYHIGSATSGSKINPLTIRLSTRNNLAVLLKNYSPRLFLRFLPAILIYQAIWLLFCLKKKMFIPYCTGILEALKMAKLFLGKRQEINSTTKIQQQAFASQITIAENEAITSIMARRSGEGKNNLLLQTYSKLFL